MQPSRDQDRNCNRNENDFFERNQWIHYDSSLLFSRYVDFVNTGSGKEAKNLAGKTILRLIQIRLVMADVVGERRTNVMFDFCLTRGVAYTACDFLSASNRGRQFPGGIAPFFGSESVARPASRTPSRTRGKVFHGRFYGRLIFHCKTAQPNGNKSVTFPARRGDRESATFGSVRWSN